ncbi:MAG: single-stranded DNA-binding protein [Candidatus Izemoplasmatales bacterium]|jgi:single-strand DNA-binding protein|nr:single-stranded DNA-binding protein [Candidatus Izemoplasmatales bacterium]
MGISYNHVVLIGRLTRDPEIKFAASGTQIASFSLAVDRGKNDETDFVNVVAFGKTAEFIGSYFVKGRLVLVEGQLRIEKYEKNGETKTAAKVIANNVRFMETKKSANGGGEMTDEEAFGKYEPGSTLRDLEVPDDDAVPF